MVTDKLVSRERSHEPLRKPLRQLRESLTRLLQVELEKLPSSSTADSDIVRMADTLLQDAVREGASDVHLDPQSESVQIRFRIDGVLHDTRVLSRAQGERIVRHFKTAAGLDPVVTFRPQDARYTQVLSGSRLDLRIASAPTICGEKLTIRLLDHRRLVHQLDELGLSEPHFEQLQRWLAGMSGLFLVTGPTGSGKTTTLYALLHQLKLLDRSIVTVEDPVEYQIDGIAQIQVDERHGLTFLEGLKTLLRLDPDYLLMGEIRDAASARAATEAAVSGRVLMSTLHSRDAVSAITALRQWGIQDHEIAAVLEVVIAQRLVRTLCPACRQPASPTAAERQWLEELGADNLTEVWRPVGCDDCKGTGYAGRTGLFEVWHVHQDDRERILRHTDETSLRNAVEERGVPRVLTDGLAKVATGVTSLEELLNIVPQCHCPTDTSRRPEPAAY